MPWGEAAAEQHEKDQPSTCLRPDGASPELPRIESRDDFEDRMRVLLGKVRLFSDLQADADGSRQADTLSYATEKLRKARAEMDQLVLMRAQQIVEEADERRRKVLERVRDNARG